MVRVRSLRTQQRAKSQCTCTYPVMGPVGNDLASTTDAKIVSMAGSPAGRDISHVSSPRSARPGGDPRTPEDRSSERAPRLQIDIQWRV
jgi:hypothetical protein